MKPILEKSQHKLPIKFRSVLCLSEPHCRKSYEVNAKELDGQFAMILLDFKRGKLLQSRKRFLSSIEQVGLNSTASIMSQKEKVNETNAPLFIFELLFILSDNQTPPEEEVWAYLETISYFHPDDVICHGAIYNLIMVMLLRRSNLSAAEELAKLSLEAYQFCGSRYLEGFIHLHLAYINIYWGKLDKVAVDLDEAQACFLCSDETEWEQSMVDVTKLWLNAEISGNYPELKEISIAKEKLIQGGFWPEPFLAVAALQYRSAEQNDKQHTLEYHSALEAILRVRGMTQLLPAMQLLREEYFSKDNPSGKGKSLALNLPERQLILLFPKVNSLKVNWAKDALDKPVEFVRIKAVQELAVGEEWLNCRRFDLAAPHYISALELIEKHQLFSLLSSEYDSVKLFLSECLKRKRFVSQARHFRNTLISNLFQTKNEAITPPEQLTSTEFTVLKRLTLATSNKSIARDLDISEATVKFHLKNIYRKLNVHSRNDALSLASAKGWIAPN